MTRPCPGPDPQTKRPAYRAPPGACDCHAHVFGPEPDYPFVADRSFTPPAALIATYLHVLDTLGIARGVIVHGSAHGTDNRVTAHALRSAGGRCRAVGVIDPEASDADIAALHALGFRGTRMSTVVKGGPGFGSLERIAAKVKPFSWHLVVHVNRSSELVELAPRLLATGTTLVIDHVARIRPEDGVDSPAFKALAMLLDTGRCWVKLSALHRTSNEGYPWQDMLPMIDAVIAHRADRVLWGTDWPHVNHYTAMPNDGDLLDAFAAWVPDERMRRRILVDNPAALYDFPVLDGSAAHNEP